MSSPMILSLLHCSFHPRFSNTCARSTSQACSSPYGYSLLWATHFACRSFFLLDFRRIVISSWCDYFSNAVLKIDWNLLPSSSAIDTLFYYEVKLATWEHYAAMINFAVMKIEVASSIFSASVHYAESPYGWSDFYDSNVILEELFNEISWSILTLESN